LTVSVTETGEKRGIISPIYANSTKPKQKLRQLQKEQIGLQFLPYPTYTYPCQQ